MKWTFNPILLAKTPACLFTNLTRRMSSTNNRVTFRVSPIEAGRSSCHVGIHTRSRHLSCQVTLENYTRNTRTAFNGESGRDGLPVESPRLER